MTKYINNSFLTKVLRKNPKKKFNFTCYKLNKEMYKNYLCDCVNKCKISVKPTKYDNSSVNNDDGVFDAHWP